MSIIKNNRFDIIQSQSNNFKTIILTFLTQELDNYKSNYITKISLEFDLEIKVKLGFLNHYDKYRSVLVNEIETLRNQGFMYKDISEYLKSRGYKSSRGKELNSKLVERMLKKKWKRNQRNKLEVLSVSNLKSNIEVI